MTVCFSKTRSIGRANVHPRSQDRAKALTIAGAVAAGIFSGVPQSRAAFTLTNTITASPSAPDITTDLTGQSAKYTAFAIASILTSPTFGNGAFTGSIVGNISGTYNSSGATITNADGSTTTSSDAGSTAYSAFQYDTNGFRLIGKYTTSSTGTTAQPNVKAESPDGQVIGSEGRSDPNSTSTNVLGTEVWLSTPTGTNTASSVNLGLFSNSPGSTSSYNNYTYTVTTNGNVFPNKTGTASSQSAAAIAGGYAVGTTGRVAGDGNPVIGVLISSSAKGGNVYGANNTSLGLASWIQTATTPTATEIGLTGTGNSYTYNVANGASTVTVGTYYNNLVTGVNPSGVAFGTSLAFSNAATAPGTSLGQDGFIYNGTASVAVGMYNSGQQASVQGYGGGPALTYNYFYSPTSNVGMTPNTSQGRSTSLAAINASSFTTPSGVVVGTSKYYAVGQTSSSNVGVVAFAYDGTNYVTLGLTANNFASSASPLPAGTTSFVNGGSTVGQMASSVNAINAAATVTGTSTTYVGQGTSSAVSGSAAWTSGLSGGATQIGIYNQGGGFTSTYTIHQDPSHFGVYKETPTFINANGLIAGTSARYSSTGGSLGQDAWVYDPTAGVTYPVDPTDEMGTGYVQENISYLSDSGILVGQYQAVSGGPFTAFLWNDAAPTTSFTLLTGVDVSGLSTPGGFQSLINAYYYGSDVNAGPIYVSASTGAAASNNVTGLGTVVVPEPASATILGLGCIGLLGRKRRNA